MKKSKKYFVTGIVSLAMSLILAISAFAAEPLDASDLPAAEAESGTESMTRSGDSWVGTLTSEVSIGSGFFSGQDISCYNHASSPGSVQFRIPGRSPIGVTPGGGCQFQDVWGSKTIYAAPISGYGTYTLSWTA